MEKVFSKKILSPAEALVRIQKYCAYQERSQQEVRNKLFQWGLHSEEVETMIMDLISNGFLKEERFTTAFTGGKFRQKKWGKIKIRLALQEKKVSEPLIRQALAEIPEKDYIKALKEVIRNRENSVKESNPFKRKHKIASYAIQRGFEPDLVWNILGQPDTE